MYVGVPVSPSQMEEKSIPGVRGFSARRIRSERPPARRDIRSEVSMPPVSSSSATVFFEKGHHKHLRSRGSKASFTSLESLPSTKG